MFKYEIFWYKINLKVSGLQSTCSEFGAANKRAVDFSRQVLYRKPWTLIPAAEREEWGDGEAMRRLKFHCNSSIHSAATCDLFSPIFRRDFRWNP